MIAIQAVLRLECNTYTVVLHLVITVRVGLKACFGLVQDFRSLALEWQLHL